MRWRISALTIASAMFAAGVAAHGPIDHRPDSATTAALATSLETPDRTSQQPTGEWLVGVWLHDASSEDVSREACNSGTVQSYEAGGKWSFFEGVGRWQLAGDTLTSTVLKMNETSYLNDENYEDRSDEIEIGKPYALPIRRIGPHEGALWSEGKWRPMLRCRPGDFRLAD